VAFDADHVYIAFQAEGIGEGADGDGVEAMLDTNLNRWSYFHVAVRASGRTTIAYYLTPGMRVGNVIELESSNVVVSRDAIEMKIPLKIFKDWPSLAQGEFIPPGQGDVRWGANFIRMPHGERPELTWAAVTNYYSHRPWEFNQILFRKTETKDPVAPALPGAPAPAQRPVGIKG
jgi:hypothetical protein